MFLILGHFPQEVHIYLDKYKLNEIPSEIGKNTEWLYDLFQKKDSKLQEINEYISQGDYVNSHHGLYKKLIAVTHHLKGFNGIRLSIAYVSFVALFVFFLGCLMSYMFFYSIHFRYYIVFTIVVPLFGTLFGNGWDSIEIALHRIALDQLSKSKD